MTLDGAFSDGTENSTVDAAAKVFEGLLSAESTPPRRETPQPPKQDEEAEPETPEDTEPVEGEEGEPAEADEAQAEEDPNDQPEEPPTFTVVIDGKEEKVTLEELQKGYSRTADYTRKTQALAESRKKFEAEERPALIAERQYIAAKYQQLEELITELTPAEPDWDRLRRERPDQFAAEWAAWDQHKKNMAALQQEREEFLMRVHSDQEAKHQQLIKTEKEALITAVPEWADDGKRREGMTQLYDYAKSLGFGEEQLQNVTDHRLILLLRKAHNWDEAQKKKPVIQNQIKQAIRTAPPGSKPAKPKVTELTKHKQRLAKTGRVKDAAGVFFEVLRSEEE
jgi:hypothetical protein